MRINADNSLSAPVAPVPKSGRFPAVYQRFMLPLPMKPDMKLSFTSSPVLPSFTMPVQRASVSIDSFGKISNPCAARSFSTIACNSAQIACITASSTFSRSARLLVVIASRPPCDTRASAEVSNATAINGTATFFAPEI